MWKSTWNQQKAHKVNRSKWPLFLNITFFRIIKNTCNPNAFSKEPSIILWHTAVFVPVLLSSVKLFTLRKLFKECIPSWRRRTTIGKLFFGPQRGIVSWSRETPKILLVAWVEIILLLKALCWRAYGSVYLCHCQSLCFRGNEPCSLALLALAYWIP